jgi:hypothetical protein
MKKAIWVISFLALFISGTALYIAFLKPVPRATVATGPMDDTMPGDTSKKPVDGTEAHNRADRTIDDVGGAHGKPPIPSSGSNGEKIEGSAFQNLQETDKRSLGAIVLDGAADEYEKQQAWDMLMTRLSNEEKGAEDFDILVSIKDEMSGEKQQSVLKFLGAMGSEAANEAIVDTFSKTFDEADPRNLTRMLSYLDPQYPLDDASADGLMMLYDHAHDEELSLAIINAVATNGNDASVAWIVAQTESAANITQELSMLSALGQSNSQEALKYLNQRLNDLVRDEDATEENKEQLRHTILHLKKQLDQKI